MFAIDFGARSIKVAKLQKSGSGGYDLVNYGAALSPEEGIAGGEIINTIATADALEDLLSKIGMRDRRAMVAITGQKVIVREISLPLMEEKELMSGVMWEAQKYVPYDLDEAIIDAEKVDEFTEKDGNKMMRVLLVAAPKNIVQPYMEVLKKPRLIPKVVDIVSSANIRTFSNDLFDEIEEKKDGSLINIILSMGASSTILTLAEKDHLKFSRDILVGGNDITNAIAKSQKISFTEAETLKRKTGIVLEAEEEDGKNNEVEKNILKIINQITKEVRKSLNYFKTQSQKVKYNKIILSGGCANIKNIDKFLGEQFEIPTMVGDPLKQIAIDERSFKTERIEKLKGSLATVIGLAKREK